MPIKLLKYSNLILPNVINRYFFITNAYYFRFSLSSHSVKQRERASKEKVFLPTTEFKIRVSTNERSSLDAKISLAGNFDGFYSWQLNDSSRRNLPLFEILDGPPFANGDAHVGHAINKILKDIILRSRVYAGKRVSFIPGWDCHGLPIELKVSKELMSQNLSPVEIRDAAKSVAQRSICVQKASFKRWGVAADWDHPYTTMQNSYVSQQLKAFAKLYEAGFVYRAFKPIYWSPSSKTALAESELEYNHQHTSTAAFFRFEVINGKKLVECFQNDNRPIKLFALIWTTTPWTLPLNDAIAYQTTAEYALVEFVPQFREKVRYVYLIAKGQIEHFAQKTNGVYKMLGIVPGEELSTLWYKCCMFADIARPFVAANHVDIDAGTGLVHTSYAHGFLDFEVSRRRGDKVYSYVDKDGRYSRQLGYELEGKFVLGEGQDAVLNLLRKHVIHTYPYVHSYPYDWRTKEPVIIRSSAQWFIDVSEVGARAAALLENKNFKIDLRASLTNLLINRSSWCISRQRHWGVPIPVFFKEDGSPITSKLLIDYLAEKVEQEGDDFWWNNNTETLFPKRFRENLGVNPEEKLTKGTDVMDVWLDSGLAWKCSKPKRVPADVVLEGPDQFRGWFQSLLLTSLALKNIIPFERVLVHCFAVDGNGKKMSKSLGNVIDPHTVIDGSLKSKPLGADGLRLWVALNGGEGSEARLGADVIQQIEKHLLEMRKLMRFLLGSISGLKNEELNSSPYFIDKYLLAETNKFVERCVHNYEEYRFRAVANEFIQFLQRPLSSKYIVFVKDRLYCGCKEDRCYAQRTLALVGLKLIACIAPILPHLATEFFMFHPFGNDPSRMLRECQIYLKNEAVHVDQQFTELVNIIDDIRRKLNHLCEGSDTSGHGLVLECNDKDLHLLRKLQPKNFSFSSELVEALNVSMVVLVEKETPQVSLRIIESKGRYCPRCRKKKCSEGQERCFQCTKALDENAP